ncbi:MAG: hypothetical protein RL119_780 [Actinomycetota bacterium]|jgi:hypothetical protein
MRTDNLIIIGLALVSVAFSVVVIMRWGRLPIQASTPSGNRSDGRWRSRLAGPLRSIGAVCSAGIICGVIVAGFLGRFVMRVLAATSGDSAQGALTDAEEVVGEITLDGTIGFILFVGLGAGFVATFVLLLARPWLHVGGAVAGVMSGLTPLVLLGGADFSSENRDFSILSPTWLAVGLIVGGAALFGAALGSVAARLQQTAHGNSRFRNVPILGVIPFALPPPLFVGLVVYMIGRTALPGRLSTALEQRSIQLAGRVLIAGLVGLSLFLIVRSSVDILSI